jgi:hypothetical protein
VEGRHLEEERAQKPDLAQVREVGQEEARGG